MRLFRIDYEWVNPELHPEHFCPCGQHPCIVRELVPDHQWTFETRHTYDHPGVVGQYRVLRQWVRRGELIRNVRLYRLAEDCEHQQQDPR